MTIFYMSAASEVVKGLGVGYNDFTTERAKNLSMV
jgi:hypothetical protein